MNTKAFEKLNYTLSLLSAANGDKHHGCIINSLHQVTASYPAKFTVTVNKDHETYQAIKASGSFSVTLLAADCPEGLIDCFGYRSGRVKDKFAEYAVKTDGMGNPYLMEHMVARISCKVVDSLDIGSYMLLVGEVTESEVLGDGPVLTLQEFTNRGKTTPSAATVYRTMAGNGFRCTVCGYIYEGESLPADYVCPICRAPASKFVKQD